jgi:hypothetical protein
MHAEVCLPHGEEQQIFKFWSHAQSHSPLSLSRSVTLQRENGDSGAESVLCVAALRRMNQLFLLSGTSGDNFRVIPRLPTALGVGISKFRKGVPLYRERSAGRPRVSEESEERVRQSFLRSPKKSVLHASRELEMSTMTVWRRCGRAWKWSPVIFTCCTFFNHFGIRCISIK